MLESTVLPALNKPKAEIARLLRVSRQSLYDILSGDQPVTPETEVRLGKLCGNGAALWVNMQAAHDVWRAERAVDVSQIPTLFAAPPRTAVVHVEAIAKAIVSVRLNADNRKAAVLPDRRKVATGLGYELAHFARKRGITAKQTRKLIDKIANDPDKFNEATEKLKKR